MISLDIDTSELSAEFSLTQHEVNQMLEYTVEEISAQFARKWETEAKSVLKSTRSIYVNSIQVKKRGQFSAAVFLNPASWLANALEMGMSSFDMKAGFLGSSKIKYTKKGNPYLTIPFRFASSSALGESSAFAGVMPQVIHTTTKSLPPGGRLKMSNIPSQYHIPKSAALRSQVKSGNFAKVTASTKMTSIYQGMQRTNGGYVNFRRVSLNSQDQSWIHPGFVKLDLANKALSKMDVPQEVDVAIDNYLSGIGF